MIVYPELLRDWAWVILPATTAAVAVGGWTFGVGQKAAEKFAEKFGEVFGEAAADWIRDRKAPFRLRYLGHLRENVRHVDLKGFATDTPFALQLRDVFIDLSLDAQSVRNISSNPVCPLPHRLSEGRHTIWDYMTDRRQRLAVIGAPGSGKTTLLKHLVLAASAPRWHRKPSAARTIPILLEIRKHARAIVQSAEQKQPEAHYGLERASREQLGSFCEQSA